MTSERDKGPVFKGPAQERRASTAYGPSDAQEQGRVARGSKRSALPIDVGGEEERPSLLSLQTAIDVAPVSVRTRRSRPSDDKLLPSSLGTIAVLFVVAAVFVIHEYVGPLVLASWFVIALQKPLVWIARRLGGRKRLAAALLTTGVVLIGLVPLVLVTLRIVTVVMDMIRDWAGAMRAFGFRGALAEIVSGAKGGMTLAQVVDTLRSSGIQAMSAVGDAASLLTSFGIQIFIFVMALYAFFADGDRVEGWLDRAGPLGKSDLHRLVQTYAQTGRGMLIGVGLTALVQAVIAGIGYFVLGVPRALALSVLTMVAALIPSIGTAIVWGPVTLGLFLAGEPGKAIAMGIIGLVTSVADNVLRPFLARAGDVPLHPMALLIAMFGGIATMGMWGLILGPLVLALAYRCTELYVEARSAMRGRIGGA